MKEKKKQGLTVSEKMHMLSDEEFSLLVHLVADEIAIRDKRRQENEPTSRRDAKES